MRFCVVLFLCMLHTNCLGDLDNLIGRPSMVVLKIDIH